METILSKVRYNFDWRWKIGFYFLLACLVLFICEVGGLDLWLSHLLYDEKQAWFLPYENNSYHFWLYKLPKILLIVIASSLILPLMASFFYKPFICLRHKKTHYFLVSLAIIPALIGALKTWTHVICPYELKDFGGRFTFTYLWEDNLIGEKGRCFPAGHPSGGFALFSLCFLSDKRVNQIASFLIVLLIAGSMSGYQMLTGRYFLSHTLVTLILAWGINDVLYDNFLKRDKNEK